MLNKNIIIKSYKELIASRYAEEHTKFFIEDRYTQAQRCIKTNEIPTYFIGKIQVMPIKEAINKSILRLYRIGLRSASGRINLLDSNVYSVNENLEFALNDLGEIIHLDFLDKNANDVFLSGEAIQHTLYVCKTKDDKFITTSLNPETDLKIINNPSLKIGCTYRFYGENPDEFFTAEFFKKSIPFVSGLVKDNNYIMIDLSYYPKVRHEDPMYATCNITTASNIIYM